MVLSSFFLILSFAINVLSPRLAGKIQVSATVIKLIPIFFMAIVGSLYGLLSGTLTENLTAVVGAPIGGTVGSGLFAAIIATVFAYDGWIVATSINAELKNPKRNLPIALLIGSIIVIVSYVLYYIGVAGGASNETLMTEGATVAFRNIFGALGATLLGICIVISCLGTLNGVMVATTRGMYAIAARGKGPRPEMFGQIDPTTNTATNSSVWGLLIAGVWMLYFYGANLAPGGGWFGVFNFDSSELPIVTLYAFYIPMFVLWMKKEKSLGAFRRFVLPSLSICACGFMIFAAVYAHGITPYLAAAKEGRFSFPVLFYLIVFAAVMLAGYFAASRRKGK
jgi:APA family basic amino acid/polyamine antiporter